MLNEKVSKSIDIDRIPLNWFGDADDYIEEDEEEELVMVNSLDDPFPDEEPEAPPVDPEVERIRRENEQLRALSQDRDAVQQGFRQIADKFNRPYSPPVNQQPPRNLEEEAETRLFKQGESGKFLREFVQDTVKPLVGSVQQQNAELEKRVLQLDPGTKEIYRDYKDEIEEEVRKVSNGGVPPLGAYQWATQQIAARHVSDLRSRDVESQVQSTLKEKLEKKGLTLDDNGDIVPIRGNKQAEAMFSETGSSRSGSGGGAPARKTKKRKYTAADKAAAESMNMDLKDYLEVKYG